MKVFYQKDKLWGRDGYYISTEYSDARFFFGTLEDIKKQIRVKAQWVRMRG